MEVADLQHVGRAANGHHRNTAPLLQAAIDHAHIGNHALVSIIVRVKDQRPQGLMHIPHGRRYLLDNRFQNILRADTFFG